MNCQIYNGLIVSNYITSLKFIFNCRIIALQCCVGFCRTSTWLSHRYTYVPSLLNLPQPPTLYNNFFLITFWKCYMLQVNWYYQLSPQSCATLCDPMDCSTPGLPVHHQLPEFTQTHAHWVSDAVQPSHPLLSPSPPTFNLSQHQGLFRWVSS